MNSAVSPDAERSVVLRAGKDKAIRNRHHWIFSGAVKRLPDFEDGDILAVRDAGGDLLGHGYFNRKCSIIGRMVSFDGTPPLEALRTSLDSALALRRRILRDRTNACRLVNGEGDGLPGLIVDRYADVLVLQVSTLGMERLKPWILDVLDRTLGPRLVLEKSQLSSRREEGLPPYEGVLRGDPAEAVEIEENGLRFRVALVQAQKTGFYLDQRENRGQVRDLAEGRRVLNAFCYTGGFTVAALAGRAASVDSVDISERAIALARENVVLNGFGAEGGGFFAEDVFDFLRRRELEYDLVILDPPAFAKKKGEVVAAARGYKDIHRIVFQKVPVGSLVLTFSCSHFVDEKLFQQILFQAAGEARRRVRVVGRHRPAADHPVNIFHPEGEYLKGFLLDVDGTEGNR